MLRNLGRLCAVLSALALFVAFASPDASDAAAARKHPGYGVHVMQFNILTGAMARGGDHRAARAANQARKTGRNVISFEEVSADQLRVLRHRLSDFSFYPKRSLGAYSSALQLAWNHTRFRAVEKGQIYRPFLGKSRAIPYVQLQNLRNKRRFWVISIHNSPGGHQVERNISTRREIKLIKRLHARHQGPVMVLGDMNEKVEFCTKVAAATDQISMSGTRAHPCPTPRGEHIDWMLGSADGERFAGYQRIENHISDHPMLIADVRLLGGQ